jgi:hypothetical protein
VIEEKERESGNSTAAEVEGNSSSRPRRYEEYLKHVENCDICSSRHLSLCPEGDRLLAKGSLP